MQHCTFLYLHIPKTAGTALVRLIEKNYPAHSRKALYAGTHLNDDFKPWLDEEEVQALYGHFYCQESFFRPDVYRYVLLRNPADREVSNYLFLRQSPDPEHRAWCQQWRHFGDYLRAKQALNHQVRMLSGMGNFAYFRDHQREALQKARAHLRRFSRIGFTESFGESVEALAQDLKWTLPEIKPHNVGRKRWLAPLLKWRYRKVLQEVTQLDRALYAYAWQLQKERDQGAGKQ